MLRPYCIATLASALLWVTSCGPDVHIHIHYNTDGGMDDEESTGGESQDGTAGDGTPPPMTTGTPPQMTTGTPPMTTGNPTADSAGSGGSTDDMYPPPEGGMCPDGLTYAEIVAGFEFCAPACMAGACPSPTMGTAPGQCVFNPASTNDACVPDEEPCATPGESCTTMGCTLSPSHCALICAGGQTCPEGMTCSPIGACQYPA